MAPLTPARVIGWGVALFIGAAGVAAVAIALGMLYGVGLAIVSTR